MNRRRLLRAGCGCSLAALAGVALAQDAWQVPPRFARPEKASDEGGAVGDGFRHGGAAYFPEGFRR